MTPPNETVVTAAEDCRRMEEVRHEIDRLDRMLVRLLAERQGYIEAAARSNPARRGAA
ncbi:MAG: hypothetical protein R3C40_05060 [Parvularculaceae bacterium]